MSRITQDEGTLRGEREADGDTNVTHYILDIEIIPEYSGSTVTNVRVEGKSTIEVEAAVDGLTVFTADLYNTLTVNAVTGNLSSWSRMGDAIEITLDRAYSSGEAFQVEITYQGHPSTAGFGAFRWWTRSGNLAVATLSQPYYAHYWWPCKDALDDKATMQMNVTVPDTMVAVSNGLEMGTQALSGSRMQYLWHETYPMIPYLASLAITNYQRYALWFSYADGGLRATMPVPCFVYPDHWDFGQGQPAASYKAGCDELLQMLDTLSGLYGLYPFVAEKYGVAETGGSGGLSASMEHQTISSMNSIAGYSDIMAHELAHQWWGDEVTCQTWYDIWLNEGFASYSEPLYREFKPGGGVDSYWTRINQRRPSLPDRQVYRTSISSVSAIFSTNDVYNKGAWVLHMLRHVMGDAAYFTAVTDYRDTFRHDSVTTAELPASFSASFGHDLSWFVEQWVMDPGSPDYQWNWAPGSAAGIDYAKLVVWQTQSGEGYGLFTMPIDIRVTTAGGTAVHTIWNDGWTEYFVIPAGGPVLDVTFDEDGGVSDRNWVLSGSRAQVATSVQGPPVVLDIAIDPFAGIQAQTVIDVVFSEDIGALDAADLELTGSGGVVVPQSVVYVSATQTATVTWSALPDDLYTFRILSADVSANGKALDGEIEDSAWWDDVLLPSGDGQPGGDAIVTFTRRHGDADGDGDMDPADFQSLPGCLTGPQAGPFAPGCGVFDFALDADVDTADYGAFTRAMGE